MPPPVAPSPHIVPESATRRSSDLQCVVVSTDDDWPAVARNLQKARATWGRLARILGREGADPKVSRNFYIAVTQQVLLFGVETWVLTK